MNKKSETKMRFMLFALLFSTMGIISMISGISAVGDQNPTSQNVDFENCAVGEKLADVSGWEVYEYSGNSMSIVNKDNSNQLKVRDSSINDDVYAEYTFNRTYRRGVFSFDIRFESDSTWSFFREYEFQVHLAAWEQDLMYEEDIFVIKFKKNSWSNTFKISVNGESIGSCGLNNYNRFALDFTGDYAFASINGNTASKEISYDRYGPQIYQLELGTTTGRSIDTFVDNFSIESIDPIYDPIDDNF